ncbi:MAG: hypothetical protein JNL32_13320 [Candidatus Kapabacteria bacterium]|nr:hypothetical protein [Candidatus Kapabacteria bacterium]
MSSFGINDFISEASKQLADYEEQEQNLKKLTGENYSRQLDIRERLRNAYTQLGATVLPDPSPDALQKIAERLHSSRLAAVPDQIAKKEKELKAKLAAIENNQQFRTRAALMQERTGVLPAQAADIEPIYTAAKQELEAMEKLPRIQRLISSGYGTSRYPHTGFFRFLNSEYLQDWKHADIICASLNMTSFTDVAARHEELTHQVQSLGESLSDIHRQMEGIRNMEKEYSELTGTLQELPYELHYQTGREVAAFLESGGENAATSFANADDIIKRYAVIDGMKHQDEYLGNLNVKINADIASLNDKAAKLRDEKLRYENDRYKFRNKSFTDEQFGKRFGNNRYANSYDRYNRMGETIYVFNDYNRASPFTEFLWWDVMTDGRLDGNFIPEVSSYRDANPDYRYERDISRNNDTTNDNSGGWTDVS